jgi:hypothetical protein
MEPTPEIVIGCFAPDPDVADIKFEWFCDDYAEDHELEYFYIESIRRLPSLFGEMITHLTKDVTVLDNLSGDIYAAADRGDSESSDRLSKVYSSLSADQFDHRSTIYYNVDDAPSALPMDDDRSFFFTRVVVFQ